MKHTNVFFVCILLLETTQLSHAQTNKEQAYAKAKEAIRLMDDGMLDQSIQLLEEAQKLDPERFDYPYEIALAYYMKKDYKTVVQKLEAIKNHKDASERLFQLLGNAYDMMGDTENAFKSYDQGLEKFPDSGMMYLEKGNVYWAKKEYNKALPFYEKGIEVDPDFSSNYYRATLLYCASKEKVWGMMYGELFMNLERNSKRTAEISKLLYDTYLSSITCMGKSSASVAFCQQMIMTAPVDTQKIKIPFCMIYEPTLAISVAFEKKIDLNSLSTIRTNFVETYFSMGHNVNYPNILFEYQQKIIQAGHMESYNHWVLMKGDEDAFEKWQSKNMTKWNAFVKWFTENKIQIDDTHKFSKSQY